MFLHNCPKCRHRDFYFKELKYCRFCGRKYDEQINLLPWLILTVIAFLIVIAILK